MNVQVLSVTLAHRLCRKTILKEFGAVCLLLLFSISAFAETHYVSLSGSHTAPFTNWTTAARDIQAAINVASDGDMVLVTNGVYATGGAFTAGMTNRVAITNAVTVRSVNGPDVTTIQGQGPMGAAAVRCAYVADGAALVGFTLTNGFTRASSGSSGSGGGIYCDSLAGIVSNCTLTGNSATESGGGAYRGTLYNCALTGNSASSGGGASYGTLYHCTLTGNSASYYGGGVYHGKLYNCIVYYNDAALGANYEYSTFNYSCTTPYSGGSGNITSEPQLASSSHLAVGSPCRGAGHSDYARGTDMDGEAWLVPPSMGCDEVVVGAITGELSVSAWAVPTNMAVGFPVRFRADILGRTTRSVWDFGDGTVLSNKPYALHAYASPGVYAVLLRAYNESDSAGITATVTVHVAAQVIHYVKLDNATPIAPYTSWATAATNIQDAINAASQVGALVLVSNGVYTTGGRVVYGALSNRVAMIKPVTVRSVNGPARTIIQGAGPVGDSAVRCAYVGTNAVLEGFTLTHGATRSRGDGDCDREQNGGGVWCESSGVLSNCVLSGNSAASDGGGACWGTFYNCTLSGNSAAYGGGASVGTLYNCALTDNSASEDGGGACWGTLYHCTLTDNSASYGGGASVGTLYHCVLTGNSASDDGGGACWGTLYHCTLTDNSAAYGGGASVGTLYHCALTGNSASYGGGACWDTLYNCTLTGNSAAFDGGGVYDGTLYNCALTANSADFGGGTVGGMLYNCTLTGNSASYGGGAGGGTLYNCIVYYNEAALGANYDSSAFNYSCTTPYPSGSGNITSEPQLASFSHLAVGSPCRGAGHSNYATGTDMDGEVWLVPPSMGCDEVVAGAITGALSVSAWAAPANVAVDFPIRFRADILGRTTKSVWNFGDGIVLSNKPYALHAYASPGVYTVLLRAYNESYPEGITATVTVHVAAQAIHYVKLDNATPVAPYTSWATAATNIQEALDAADQVGALVLVGNGVYTTGGRVVYGALSNRVAMIKPVTVRSVNGPAMTIIQGAGPRGDSAVRCAYVGTNAVLEGFTLTHGATRSSGDVDREQSGGGVWCEGSGVLRNCVLSGNSAFDGGGGAFWGTLYNCTFTDNLASNGSGGGASLGTLYNCVLTGNSASCGGGVSYGTLYHCTLTGNSAVSDGGGASYGTLYNCMLTGNSADFGGGAGGGMLYHCTLTSNAASYGGGASYGMLYNCTLTGNLASSGGGSCWGALYNCALISNLASNGGGAYNGKLYNCTLTGNSASADGGGAYNGTLYNSIVYYNTASSGSNYWDGTLTYSCTTPDPGGIGNIIDDPRFVNVAAGDYHLQSVSPCINAGTNQDWMVGATDLDGNPRLYVGGRVDMGAYEYQGMSIWSDTMAPTVVDGGPDSPVALGVKIRSDVDVAIAGIRFYKAAANTGTHVGNLWASDGTLLATATFTNETASGWQQALFAAPMTIASNTVYVASYHANNGHYSVDFNYFQGKGVDNPPLHALADGVAGGNGVYAYGSSSTFPNQTYRAANYWVDVVLLAGSPPAPTLMAITVTPANPSILIGAMQQFTATGIYSDGSTQDITSQATWTSSSPGVATINAGGLATGISAGFTTISATLSDLVGATALTVNAPLVITTISLPNGIRNEAYTGTLTAVHGTSPYTWSISDGALPSGLTLNAVSGVITGKPTASGIFSFTAQVRDSGSPAQMATKSLSISVAINIWSNTAAPTVVDGGPDRAVELGVKFRSDVTGTIAGIRFYKADANTGTHIGNLWSSRGMRLATVLFSNETASGWQEALFDTPVAIASNTVYVASYHANNGHYSCDVNYFMGKGMDHSPLHALAHGVSGGNGVYRYGTSSLFPNQTWYAANYWVDVVFLGRSPPTLISIAVTPVNPSILIGARQQFTATGTYSDGSMQDITRQATWISSDTGVVTINARGLAKGISAGTATLSATLSGVVGATTLRVNTPLVITTTSLPKGVSNAVYTAMLAADGGTTPYMWSISSGSLPSGLTLNAVSGVITGKPTVLGIFSFTVQVRDSGSPAQTATKPLSISVAINIWSNTMAPTVVDGGPDRAAELGVKFRSDMAGTIAGIRFYKADANTGVHVGNLWTRNGTLLATVLFSNETASGWQEALFDTPVTIASNTVYVASYHANNGHYSCDVNYFMGKGMDNAPLHALAYGVASGNGVYRYGANSAFPNQTWYAANYWVDVVFLARSPPPPLTSITLMAADASTCEAVTSAVGGKVERWPSVWTSGDLSKECGVSNLIDGDMNTMWIGNVGGEPWRVILDLGVVTDVADIQVMFEDTAWTNKEIIGSQDSEVWFDYLAETNEWVPLRYLYVNFWGDEHGVQPPAIREIIWRDR